ncbi:MAG: hypothetical protein IKL07_05165 [Clostridium sp.]|nr:hypothetical protein [Clostridium sp.]
MVSKDKVICPYCKANNAMGKALGNSGLVNYKGGSRSCICDICKNQFHVEYEVLFKFRTSKD